MTRCLENPCCQRAISNSFLPCLLLGGAMFLVTSHIWLNFVLWLTYSFVCISVYSWLFRQIKRIEGDRRRLAQWTNRVDRVTGLPIALLPKVMWMRRPWDEDDEETHSSESPESVQEEGASRRVGMILQIDQTYLMLLSGLSRNSCHGLMNQLRDSPITNIEATALPNEEYSRQRWLLLCRTLSSIPTIQHAVLKNIRATPIVGNIRAVAALLQQMPQVSHVALHEELATATTGGDAEEGRSDWTELAQALRYHPKLSVLEIMLSTSSYRHICRVLSSIPTLRQVVLSSRPWTEIDVMDMRALALYVKECPLDGLALHGFHFTASNKKACQRFVHGISQVTVQTLCLSNILMPDPKHLAEALATSNVSELTIRHWPGHDAEGLTVFLTSLAERRFPVGMERVDVEELVQEGADDSQALLFAMESALPRILRAASQSSTLRELILPEFHYSETLDKALASLVDKNDSRLLTLSIGHPLRDPADQNPVYYPHFQRALSMNVTIQHILLMNRYAHVDGSNLELLDPWCRQFRHEVAMITCLNQSGRAYLREDSTNQLEGFRLLERVTDYLDCVFFHLRENPSLCRPLPGHSDDPKLF